jgi:pilus assembly protein Flp/PilA
VLQLQLFISQLVQRVRDREEGQGLVEYSLIVGLISVVAIGVLTGIGDDITSVLSKVVSGLDKV